MKTTLTSRDLVQPVLEKLGTTRTEAETAVRAVLDALAWNLERLVKTEGARLELRGIGSFRRAVRMSDGKVRAAFRPGKRLRGRPGPGLSGRD